MDFFVMDFNSSSPGCLSDSEPNRILTNPVLDPESLTIKDEILDDQLVRSPLVDFSGGLMETSCQAANEDVIVGLPLGQALGIGDGQEGQDDHGAQSDDRSGRTALKTQVMGKGRFSDDGSSSGGLPT